MPASEKDLPTGASRDIDTSLEPLLSAVQTNCHISDARHAGDYTMCVYLLKMREYYRWEVGEPFSAALPHADISAWLTDRERLWERLESESYIDLPVSGEQHDPYAVDNINKAINGKGWVYSGGIGRNAKPHFFLGRLKKSVTHNDYQLLVSGREYARDLTAPPAMSLGKTIFIRRESLKRMLWEKIEEWQWAKGQGAMSRTIACYDFENDSAQALDDITDHEMNSTLLHEIGEIQAREHLGSLWEELLLELTHSRAEIMVRAVRDHLADTLSTLPGLIENSNTASLHFYFANLKGMRRELWPSLLGAYDNWLQTGDTDALQKPLENSKIHWLELARSLLDLYGSHGGHCVKDMESLIQKNRL